MNYPTSIVFEKKRQSGFALVISLSLMAFVLLLLLSISTLVQVETSVANTSIAKLESEQNAILAVYQALGTLQKEMGPDQRISANADILDDSVALPNDNAIDVKNPYMVGVWDTSGDKDNDTVSDRLNSIWQIEAGAIDYVTRGSDSGGFRRWLISSPQNPVNELNPEFFDLASNDDIRDEDSLESIRLLGEGTLQPDGSGSLSTSDLEDREVWAPLVRIEPEEDFAGGGLGWAVLDEGVKARFNLEPREAPSTASERLAFWDNSGTLGIEAMGESGEFSIFPRSDPSDKLKIGRVTNFENTAQLLNAGVDKDVFASYFHDVSFYSKSVLANVVNGGLKLDLSTLAEERPSEFADKRIYSDEDTGSSVNSEADPHWSAVFDYVTAYKDNARWEASGSTSVLPTARATLSEWQGGSNLVRASIDSPLPSPNTYRLAPSIVQIEMYMSLIALKPHDGDNRFRGGGTFYTDKLHEEGAEDQNDASHLENAIRQIYLCVAPAITLHNPYNVPLKLEDMWLVMRDPPVGLKFYRYNHEDTSEPGESKPLTTDFIAISEMLDVGWAAGEGGDIDQLRLSMKLTNDGTVTSLAPGEALIFSPRFSPGLSVADLTNERGNKHFNLEALPGYDAGVGVYWDQFSYKHGNGGETVQITGAVDNGEGGYTIVERSSNVRFNNPGLAMIKGDRLKIEANLVDGTQNPGNGSDSSTDPGNGIFSVELYSSDPQIGTYGSEGAADASLIGRYAFDYNRDSIKSTSENDREEFIAKSVSLNNESYGSSAQGVVVAEELNYNQLFLTDGTRSEVIVENLDPYTFAVFRVGGKVTKGGDSNRAFHPSAAWAQTNGALLAGHYHIGEESPGYKAFDLSVGGPIDGLGKLSPNIGDNDEGFHFTGSSETFGKSDGTQYEVPVTPLQSLASLQHADIFGGGYLPRVRYAVGNSQAHPLITSSRAIEPAAGNAVEYGFYDHSYLSNYRVWDRFYLSTLSDERSVFNPSGSIFSNVVDDWLNGDKPAMNASLVPYLPEGTIISDVRGELVTGASPQAEAYNKVAAYQMLDGGFNINSTSVEAWKAILSTSNVANNLIQMPAFSETLQFLDAKSTSGVASAFSRFRIPNYAEPVEFTGDDYFSQWQGYRELDEVTVDALAEEIVKQVRYRGPFLSLAEFVNRRLSTSTSSDERSQMGVIDAAIETTIGGSGAINAFVEAESGVTIDQGFLNTNDYSMTKNADAREGSTARNIPGYLTQADILQQIGSKLSARSDTFTIRAYGEARGILNTVTARSTCEVVVQRIPDYVDSSQEAYHDDDLSTSGPVGLSATNERWGRRFEIVQFRWLDQDEI